MTRATLRNHAEAEDALQDAYLSAYRGTASSGGKATWLLRLVLNECLKRLRRQARRGNVVPMVALPTDRELESMRPSNPETPDKALVRHEKRALLERKLDALPEAFRVVFVLRCVEEMIVEETVAVTCAGR